MKFLTKISPFFVIVLFVCNLSTYAEGKKNSLENNGIKGDVCIVNEEEKQMTKFNFRIISNESMEDQKIKMNESNAVIHFQLCTPLKTKCSGQTDTSICLKNKEKEIILGKYPPKVLFESFQISFKFIGDKCNETANYTTIVTMQCDYNATGNKSYPVFSHKEQCEIYVLWKTASACGEELSTNCLIADEAGNKYDLSKLTKFADNYEIGLGNSSKLIFNVCHSLIFGHGVSCKYKSASCLVNVDKLSESGLDLGDVKNPLVFVDGHLRIEYHGGSICTFSKNENENHFKTVIDFICDHIAQDPHPTILQQECVYKIEIRTPFACKNYSKIEQFIVHSQDFDNSVMGKVKPEKLLLPTIRSVANKQVNCSLTTERDKIDLGPLIRSETDYVAKSNDSEFLINVCSPLNSVDNLNACQGKAVCKIHHGNKDSILSKSNLGNPGNNLSVRNEQNEHNVTVRNVILHYKTDTSCLENDKRFISTNITFTCNYGTNEGSPQFDKYVNCTYLFGWQTKYVCESVIGNFYENCTISNPLSRTINLSVLRDQTFYANSKEKKQFSINVCGKKLCSGSTVCEGNNGYGSSVNVIYEYPKDSVKLKFTKGTKCLDGTFESSITFVCNSSIDVGSPTLVSESRCESQFEWQTKLVCTSESTKKPVPSNEIEDSEKQAQYVASSGALVVFSLTGIAVIIVIIIYLRNPSRRARCYRTVSNPCSSSNNDRVKYCRINTTEEARLLLDNCEPTTVCQTDSSSDDDLLGA